MLLGTFFSAGVACTGAEARGPAGHILVAGRQIVTAMRTTYMIQGKCYGQYNRVTSRAKYPVARTYFSPLSAQAMSKQQGPSSQVDEPQDSGQLPP